MVEACLAGGSSWRGLIVASRGVEEEAWAESHYFRLFYTPPPPAQWSPVLFPLRHSKHLMGAELYLECDQEKKESTICSEEIPA